MYKTGATPTKLPNETHRYIWDEQNLPNTIVSADGSKILYGYADPSTPRQLHLVDTATGAKSFILQTSSLGLDWPTLSADGSLARISPAASGPGALICRPWTPGILASSWFDEYGTIGASAGLSDLTLDNRRYFLASKKAANNAAIHCIDMAPTDFSQAPNITNIAFNRTFLPFDDSQFITVTAQLSDVKGLGTLQWVHILSLWGGGVATGRGDLPASQVRLRFLYDDGSNGDLVAGDGIYTNNTITVQKWSEFSQDEPPAQEGRPAPHRQEHGFPLYDRRHRILGGQPGQPGHQCLITVGLNCREVTPASTGRVLQRPCRFFPSVKKLNEGPQDLDPTTGKRAHPAFALLPFLTLRCALGHAVTVKTDFFLVFPPNMLLIIIRIAVWTCGEGRQGPA